MHYEREVVAGYTKEYLCMKTGSRYNSLMFITLADLPPKPKPFPKVECTNIMLWSKSEHRDWLKTQNKNAGATDGNSSTSKKKGRCRCKQSPEESAHPYLWNEDGTLVANLSDMSSKICEVWESLERRRMAPKTFGKISSEAWEFIARVALPLLEFEFLLYCSDGEWKLKEWCKTNYSLWTCNHSLRQLQAKKTENVEDILNSSKLLRMDTPEGELSADNLGSKTGSEDSKEEDDDDSSSEDKDDKMAPSPVRQQVCPTSL
jgi:hypothetical protein